MRWTGLHIPNYQQFEDLHLDFTDPTTGKPLEKVCFIGGNGTGKTTLLRMLFLDVPQPNIMLAQYRKEGKEFVAVASEGRLLTSTKHAAGSQINAKDYLQRMHDLAKNLAVMAKAQERNSEVARNAGFDLSVFAQADSNLGILAEMRLPKTNLSDALALSPAKFPIQQFINSESIREFWALLIYHIKQRESRYSEFRRLPENKRRIVEDVDREFEEKNPDVLRPLAKLWSEILDSAGLVFDYEKAKLPVQLTDNLEAYVHLKDSGERLGYNQLSTGIRQFLFRLGHIFAIHYNQSSASSLVLIDEPENSLFVDLQRKLVSLYQKAAPGAQLFMATHSPLIAAQFKPEERFILEFDPDRPGKVIARRGVAPEGDDPNDVLTQDFGMEEVMSEAGVLAWERYIKARRTMQQGKTESERDAATQEYHELGQTYHFTA